MSSVLQRISGPADLRRLDPADLDRLAAEIRQRLITQVSRTGGHLGPNLGVVELTIALHRTFDSPTEPILFDTGHQSYVHKMLTGRSERFDSLRQIDGLSGYPSRSESPHDWIENSHASTSLSYADGLAKAFDVAGDRRPVVAVVGDGALTGGMSWEALNNIAASDRPVIIVVNDNGRSYSPTIGGLAEHLAGLRLRPGYERVLRNVKGTLGRTPVVGPPLYDALHGLKRGVKDMLAPQGMFEDLGLKYLGPVDGHDIAALEHAFGLARQYGGPVIVHCVTRKGHGFAPAENHLADQMHAVGVIDPETGEQLNHSGGRSWTKVFADEIVQLGAEREDIVAVTAAMLDPVGFTGFAARFPERTFDVGIAEQHALTSAAGMAAGGLHPVVALYATFLNRAFDQLLMDVALHHAGVTIVLDRSGVTGEDGASHNGMWDLALLGIVPGLRLAAPRDEPRLRRCLGEAVDVSDAPTVLRYPKTPMGGDVDALRSVEGVDVLAEPDAGPVDVLLVAVGALAADVLSSAERVSEAGYRVRVVDPVWVAPIPDSLVELARQAQAVVTVEDGVVVNGVGSRLSQRLREAGITAPTRELGIPVAFLDHGKVADVKARIGLTPQGISRRVVEFAAAVVGRDQTGSEVIAGAPELSAETDVRRD
ncbi:1-deoxy-D-xylulose-5-phosphate synthase [Jatrophihabitans telluris]|uniref:1-deoxy-D-xylulose-5-phosphate synthase n=1 Tax=Jatrophihabitans telluris TaxID=2038343 RepID=A0ABY4QS25_9ACTN|nr:1-deoxy-D-xylulose-5-phosphate synthase [Jatrophihabitans telluris]UQX86696.1 1-deoxy-D-xylulose-5-phosphate synthase [Jatrophihabitans telluris]